VLQALGSVDYGLMGVVGAVILFVAFLTTTTSGTISRFYAYSIGQGDPEETNRWFNTALSIHTILPIVLCLISWPCGEWAIRNFFNVPPDRLVTALWVFRFSLVAVFFGLFFTPYLGMFTAKQRIYEMSFWGILGTIINFVFAYFLVMYKGDAWLLYSGGTVVLTILLGLLQVLRARFLFKECKIFFSKWYDVERIKQVFSFAGWSLLTTFSTLVRNQGLALLLNKCFTPTSYPEVNASYAIGNSVASQSQSLSSAFLGALSPEITASEGRGDRERMLFLSMKASKLLVFLIALFAVPLLVDLDFVLVLWLKTPPALATVFCRVMLIALLVDNLSMGLMVATYASGQIRRYQIVMSIIGMSTIVVAFVFVLLGCGPQGVAYGYLCTAVMASFSRVVIAKINFDVSVFCWLTTVVFPCIIVIASAFFLGFIVTLVIASPSFVRLVCVSIGTTIGLAGSVFLLGLDRGEKQYLFAHASSMIKRIGDIK